jgi:Glycosyl transferase family 2
MILIVRDELALIEANIEFHARQGFDHFVVMDNASVDGTREALEKLARTYSLEIVSQSRTNFEQAEWASQLATRLREVGLDWGIVVDADEFISSSVGTIKDVLGRTAGPVLAPRQNIIPSAEALGRPDYDSLADCLYRVANPIGPFDFSTGLRPDFPVNLRSIPGKALFPLKGLRSLGAGGHTLAHEHRERSKSRQLLIRHFSVRRLDQFNARLDQWEERFRQEIPPKPISHHLHRWLRLREQGLLEQEYAAFGLNREAIELYLADGTIVADDFGPRLGGRRAAKI